MRSKRDDSHPPEIAMAPRAVPATVCARLLFGGFMNQFGWFFVGFGMIFVWVFAAAADFSGVHAFRGELETTPGTIDGSEQTSYSEGGSEHTDGTPVFAVRYTFTDADENEYAGMSYQTGTGLDAGTAVTVEYPRGRPEMSRIRGMRRAPFGPWVAFVLIFPLIGAVFVLNGLRRGMRGLRLLKHGDGAFGTLKRKEATNVQVNDRTVYELTFAFTARDGQTYEMIAKSHHPERLEDERRELLMYDPGRPARAVLLDALPGSPRIDEYGQVRAGSLRAGLLVASLPVVTLVGHGVYAWLRFGS